MGFFSTKRYIVPEASTASAGGQFGAKHSGETATIWGITSILSSEDPRSRCPPARAGEGRSQSIPAAFMRIVQTSAIRDEWVAPDSRRGDRIGTRHNSRAMVNAELLGRSLSPTM